MRALEHYKRAKSVLIRLQLNRLFRWDLSKKKSHFFKGSPIFYRLGGEGLSIFGGSVLSGGTVVAEEYKGGTIKKKKNWLPVREGGGVVGLMIRILKSLMGESRKFYCDKTKIFWFPSFAFVAEFCRGNLGKRSRGTRFWSCKISSRQGWWSELWYRKVTLGQSPQAENFIWLSSFVRIDHISLTVAKYLKI